MADLLKYYHALIGAPSDVLEELQVLTFNVQSLNLAGKTAEIVAKTNIASTMYYAIHDAANAPDIEDIETGSGALDYDDIACPANTNVFRQFSVPSLGTYYIYAFFRDEQGNYSAVFAKSVVFVDNEAPSASMATVSAGELSFTARLTNGTEDAYLFYAIFSAAKPGLTRSYIISEATIGVDDCIAKGGQTPNEIFLEDAATHDISITKANSPDLQADTQYYIYWFLRDVNYNNSDIQLHNISTIADATVPQATIADVGVGETSMTFLASQANEDLTIYAALYSQDKLTISKGAIANAVKGENDCLVPFAPVELGIGDQHLYTADNTDNPNIIGSEDYYFIYYLEDLAGNTTSPSSVQVNTLADTTAPIGTVTVVPVIGNIDFINYIAANTGGTNKEEDAIFKYAAFSSEQVGSEQDIIDAIFDAQEDIGNCVQTNAETPLAYGDTLPISVTGLQAGTTYYLYAYFRDANNNYLVITVEEATKANQVNGAFGISYAYVHETKVRVEPGTSADFYQFAIYSVPKPAITTLNIENAVLGDEGCIYKSVEDACVPSTFEYDILSSDDIDLSPGQTYYLYGFFKSDTDDYSDVKSTILYVSTDVTAPEITFLSLFQAFNDINTYEIHSNETGTLYVSIFEGTETKPIQEVINGTTAKYHKVIENEANVAVSKQFYPAEFLKQNTEYSMQVVAVDNAFNTSSVYSYAFTTAMFTYLYNMSANVDSYSTGVSIFPSYDGAGKLYAAIYQQDFEINAEINASDIKTGATINLNGTDYFSDNHGEVALPFGGSPELRMEGLVPDNQYYLYFFYENVDGTMYTMIKHPFVTGSYDSVIVFGVSSSLSTNLGVINSGSELTWAVEGIEYHQNDVPVEHPYQGIIESFIYGVNNFQGLKLISINGGLTGVFDIRQWKNTDGYIYLNISNCDVTQILAPAVSTDFRLYAPECNLTGTLDLSAVTGITYLWVQGNDNLTDITLPSTNTLKWLNAGRCNLGYIDLSGLTGLLKEHDSAVILENNAMTAAEVNRILYDIDQIADSNYTGRRVDIGGAVAGKENAAPDQTSGGYNGELAVASLQSKGITVNHNGEPILSADLEYDADSEFYYE